MTNNPYTVFIFDELDKAHPEVLKTFMSILDEGRCASRKELPDHSREFDFKHCIFFFTSNYCLESSSQKKVGFSLSEDITGIFYSDNAVAVTYRHEDAADDTSAELTKRIYRNTESARKAFMQTGVLREIASRFTAFVEFKELTNEAKVRILAKQIIETGFEYDLKLSYIAPGILQALANASLSGDALTVRSFKSVIEGYLAEPFADAGAKYPGQLVRLDGTIDTPNIIPENS